MRACTDRLAYRFEGGHVRVTLVKRWPK